MTIPVPDPVPLTGARLGQVILRPLASDDAPALLAAVRDSLISLTCWFDWCRPDYGLVDAQARIAHCMAAWARGDEFAFGIFDQDGERLLGCTGLSQVSAVDRSANLGYWVGESFRGRGIATVAAAAVVDFGFARLGLERIEVAALAHNQASLRVADKLGARREGEFGDRLVFQGRPAVAVVYSLTQHGPDAPGGSRARGAR